VSEALLRPLEELAADLAGGRIRARQLAEEAIANHERHGGGLLAYSQWAPAHALQCAAAADAAFAAGSCAGPLQGIPVSIKDLFAHPGFATFAGSPRRLPPKFEIDGPVVAGLRRQLAVAFSTRPSWYSRMPLRRYASEKLGSICRAICSEILAPP